MRSQHLLFTFLAVAILLPVPAPAQTTQIQTLTLHQAEQIALQNHPRVQAAENIAAASKAQVTQARSAYYPTVYGSLTGVYAENDSRIGAGALNNPVIYDRFAEGITANQLVTDFGRTHELVKSSNLRAQAQQENVVTTRADVLLGADRAYFGVLKAQAVLGVARETVKTRQLVSDQVTELEKNKIKSGLDVSFANVDLAQAQLLLIQAQNDLQASFAQLSDALGYSDDRTFVLAEEAGSASALADLPSAIQQALRDRPELIGQRFNANAAQSYATAERDLWMPTISAVGMAGLIPFRQDTLSPRYAAAGFNVNIPLFNGRLFGALHTEANEEAKAQDQYLRGLQNRIVRDVRTAWLSANSGFQRLAVTDKLLAQANLAVELAQSRYKLGLSSIVELSQAQLNQTQAQIEEASAKYDYEAEISELEYQTGSLH